MRPDVGYVANPLGSRLAAQRFAVALGDHVENQRLDVAFAEPALALDRADLAVDADRRPRLRREIQRRRAARRRDAEQAIDARGMQRRRNASALIAAHLMARKRKHDGRPRLGLGLRDGAGCATCAISQAPPERQPFPDAERQRPCRTRSHGHRRPFRCRRLLLDVFNLLDDRAGENGLRFQFGFRLKRCEDGLEWRRNVCNRLGLRFGLRCHRAPLYAFGFQSRCRRRRERRRR